MIRNVSPTSVSGLCLIPTEFLLVTNTKGACSLPSRDQILDIFSTNILVTFLGCDAKFEHPLPPFPDI